VIGIILIKEITNKFLLFVADKTTCMNKIIYCFIGCFLFTTTLYAKGEKDSLQESVDKEIKFMDSVNSAMKWQTGTVALSNGVAKLNLTANFKFLNAEQSAFILHNVWGNPPRTDILGMLFPANGGPFADSSFAFIITYDNQGYVKDDDADKINYEDMMNDLKKAEPDENKERIAQGYQPIYMIGWAQPPYYDKVNKVLHWAK
jgi:uncharacterized membrane-anchored protein